MNNKLFWMEWPFEANSLFHFFFVFLLTYELSSQEPPKITTSIKIQKITNVHDRRFWKQIIIKRILSIF